MKSTIRRHEHRMGPVCEGCEFASASDGQPVDCGLTVMPLPKNEVCWFCRQPVIGEPEWDEAQSHVIVRHAHYIMREPCADLGITCGMCDAWWDGKCLLTAGLVGDRLSRSHTCWYIRAPIYAPAYNQGRRIRHSRCD